MLIARVLEDLCAFSDWMSQNSCFLCKVPIWLWVLKQVFNLLALLCKTMLPAGARQLQHGTASTHTATVSAPAMARAA